MNIILLSGGSGKRLWPLSNNIRSKQFIKIFKNDNGEYESMLERMYKYISSVDSSSNVTIATSKSQVSAIRNQLGENINISVEPVRKDTFPAIVLAASYLHDIKKVKDDEIVIVCPVDPYVEEDYFKTLKEFEKVVKKDNANLFLIGIEPTYPSEKYGYIIPNDNNKISKVKSFKVKPTKEKAIDYLKQNALWNSGVFAFKMSYMLEKAHNLIDFKDYKDLYKKYENIDKISFDYAVVEKESNIKVMRFLGKWKDLGTWNTLTEAMDENIIGNAILNNTCHNIHVLNELDIPILCMGLNNIVVAASPEGILVSDKNESSYIKPYVDNIDDKVMFAEKSWGSFKTIDIQENSMTLLVTLNKNNKMSYHSHKYRDEVWTIISGKAKVIIDDEEKNVQAGDVITIPQGSKHTIIALTEIKIIEVQLGNDISVKDKQKYDFIS
ncbi:MAG: sugar phosphate nucleotidyltransferase [Bacilli bacterium]